MSPFSTRMPLTSHLTPFSAATSLPLTDVRTVFFFESLVHQMELLVLVPPTPPDTAALYVTFLNRAPECHVSWSRGIFRRA